MSMFKHCSTAVALVLASSVPAFAQDSAVTSLALPEGFVAPEGSVVLQFAGTEALYVVPDSVAAELCRVTEGEFAAVAESGVDVIYCEQLDEATFATFSETGGVETLLDRRDGGDDSAEAMAGDDAGDSAEADDGTDDMAGGDDASGDDSAEGDEVADGEVDAGGDAAAGGDDGAVGTDDGADDGAESNDGGTAEVEAEAEASAEAGAEVDSSD